MAAKTPKSVKAQHEIAEAVRYLADKNKKPPEHLIETGKALMLLANLAAGALVFKEGAEGFISNPRLALVGIFVVLAIYMLGLYVMRGGGRQ